jgi:hypothetical protein
MWSKCLVSLPASNSMSKCLSTWSWQHFFMYLLPIVFDNFLNVLCLRHISCRFNICFIPFHCLIHFLLSWICWLISQWIHTIYWFYRFTCFELIQLVYPTLILSQISLSLCFQSTVWFKWLNWRLDSLPCNFHCKRFSP